MLESLAVVLFLWVSRYIACFCLVSIAIWAMCMYFGDKNWQVRVRDAGIFFSTIGVLTVLLILKPAKTDALFWTPLTWFCFSMLLILELLWLEFLLESILRGLVHISKPASLPDNTPQFPSRSSTPRH